MGVQRELPQQHKRHTAACIVGLRLTHILSNGKIKYVIARLYSIYIIEAIIALIILNYI